MIDPDADHRLAQVPVHAAVLTATARLLELLRDFFAETDPKIRARLGSWLIDRHGEQNTTDPASEAVATISELSDAAHLLHALAGDDPDELEQE